MGRRSDSAGSARSTRSPARRAPSALKPVGGAARMYVATITRSRPRFGRATGSFALGTMATGTCTAALIEVLALEGRQSVALIEGLSLEGRQSVARGASPW